MTGGNKPPSKGGHSLEDLLKMSEGQVWALLEEEIVAFYSIEVGVKREQITPEVRRALCAGYSFCSGHFGSALMTDPSALYSHLSPQMMLKQAMWVLENRLKQSIGN